MPDVSRPGPRLHRRRVLGLLACSPFLTTWTPEWVGCRSTNTYSFALILAGVDELTIEMADALYEAGCDDSTPCSRGTTVYVHFDREAASLEGAIKSANRDVRKAGFSISRIEIEVDDLDV